MFHGTEAVCQVLETKQITYTTNHNLRWDEWLEFDISQPDLPRAAKLCLSICSIKRRKNRCETTMLFWWVPHSLKVFPGLEIDLGQTDLVACCFSYLVVIVISELHF